MNSLSLFKPTFSSDVFDALDRGLGFFTPLSTSTREVPRVDVRETKDSYIMDFELPGLTEKDVEISLKDRVLTISSVKEASREEKKNEDDVQYLIRERRDLCFTRRFTLPEDINAENVNAEFKNGLLAISIGRRPESKPKQIQIKTA